MSDYNWCHGPACHTRETQSRIRGSGRDKVLRTRRIKYSHWNSQDRYSMFNYFCGNNCLFDYLSKHIQSIIAIAPRREALETPIKVEKEKYESHRYIHNGNDYVRTPYQATRTTIKSVDNDNG